MPSRAWRAPPPSCASTRGPDSTATILPKTCSNSGAWQPVTAGVTAGHSYTLTLTSHDDNYPADPTYTNYDDVAVQ